MKNKKMTIAIGMVSSGKDKTINYPSLEYDDKDLDFVINDVKRLQKKFLLGDAIIVKTRKGFHVHFFWDWNLDWETVCKIINESKAPEDFKKISEACGFRVIRISGKYKSPDMKILMRIEGYHACDETGNLLFAFYKKLMNLKLPEEMLYE